MQNLFPAIHAEESGDLETAIKLYKEMSENMDHLGRIWTYKSIARCYEKMGNTKEAMLWWDKVVQGYPSLPARAMGYRESVFYALVEVRNALEKVRNNPELFKKMFNDYSFIMDKCLNRYLFPPSGLSHEVLSLAIMCEKNGLEEKAADYYYWCGELYRELVKEEPALADPIIFLGKRCCELAAQIYTKLGMKEKTEKATKRIDTIKLE